MYYKPKIKRSETVQRTAVYHLFVIWLAIGFDQNFRLLRCSNILVTKARVAYIIILLNSITAMQGLIVHSIIQSF